MFGSDQERALQQAATAAVQLSARGFDSTGGERALQLAMVISEVFGAALPDAPLAGRRPYSKAYKRDSAEAGST